MLRLRGGARRAMLRLRRQSGGCRGEAALLVMGRHGWAEGGLVVTKCGVGVWMGHRARVISKGRIIWGVRWLLIVCRVGAGVTVATMGQMIGWGVRGFAGHGGEVGRCNGGVVMGESV